MKCLLNTPPGIPIEELTGLAVEKGFDGIQLYLNDHIAAEVQRLDEWCLGLEQEGLDLVVHLPPDPQPQVLQALHRIGKPGTVVISHYPDHQYQADTGTAAWEFSPFGVRPGGYAAWLEHCRVAGAIPVLDLPRIFKGSGLQEAHRFADQLFTSLAGVRYILHLIDCETPEQERSQWCELGKGRVGGYLEQAVFPLPEMAVLEYESLIQSINSLPWLRRLARQLGH